MEVIVEFDPSKLKLYDSESNFRFIYLFLH